jgi:hypothetical protein
MLGVPGTGFYGKLRSLRNQLKIAKYEANCDVFSKARRKAGTGEIARLKAEIKKVNRRLEMRKLKLIRK